MTQTQHAIGTYRKLTATEIGQVVASCRKEQGMKQITLADRAGVNEKTIQRLENGTVVGVATLEAVALALGFPEDSFTKIHFVPDVEALKRESEEFWKSHQVIDAHEVKSWRDFLGMVDAHASSASGPEVDDDTMELLLEFNQAFIDTIDVCSLSDEARADGSLYKDLMARVATIENRGYVCKHGVSRTTEGLAVVHVVFFKPDDQGQTPSQLVVPKSMLAMQPKF